MKIKEKGFSEPLINFYQTTWDHIPEDVCIKMDLKNRPEICGVDSSGSG
jgi:hypothetical protein